MKKPPKKSKGDLVHPKDRRSPFNGAPWRNERKSNLTSTVKTVEGTTPPTNCKPVTKAHLTSDGHVAGSRDVTGAIKPVPEGHVFRPSFVKDSVTSPSRSFSLPDLKKHQEKMLNKKKKR